MKILNYLKKFFTDFNDRKVSFPSYLYGFFSGILIGILLVIIFPNISVLTFCCLVFFVSSRIVFLRLPIRRKTSDYDENDYYEE